MSAQTEDSTSGGSVALEASAGSDYLVTPAHEQTPTISVVLPTLNEEDGISECIERICTALSELQIHGEIILSDSSTDRTPQIGAAMGARVVEPDQPGYGYAYRYAFDHAAGDYIVMGDADTTYDFEELPKLLDPVLNGDADICMGSRLNGEIKSGAMPWLHQYIGNPLLTRFLNTFYDAGVSDAHSGFRVFHRDALEELALQSDGMEFASEMVMAAGAQGLTIAEVPITYHEREGEATLDSFQDGWRHVRFMLKNAPGYLFTAPGILLGITGLLITSLALLNASVFDLNFGVHALLGGSLLLLVGYQISLFGLFAALSCDPINRPNDRFTESILDRLSLERGVAIGGVLTITGLAIGAYILLRWGAAGFAGPPLTTIRLDILTLLPMVIGLQTMFNSFYLSMLIDKQESRPLQTPSTPN